jgi:hypothetical protein
MRWDLSRLTCTLLRMRSLAGRPGSCTSLVSSSVMEEMSRRTKLPIEKGVYVPSCKVMAIDARFERPGACRPELDKPLCGPQ